MAAPTPLPPPPSPPPLRGRSRESSHKRRAHWDDERRAYLVKLLNDYNTPDYRTQKGWTKQAWNMIYKQVHRKYPSSNLTMSQIKDQEQHLKKIYKFLKKLLESEGFTWDYQKNTVAAPPDVWQHVLQSDSKAEKWHGKSFPFYHSLDNLYSGEDTNEKGLGKHSEGDDQEPVDDDIVPIHSLGSPILALEEAPNGTKEVDDTGGSSAEPSPAQEPTPDSQPQSSESTGQLRSKVIYGRGLGRKKRRRKGTFKDDYVVVRVVEKDRYTEAMEKKARLKAELQISVMEKQRKLEEDAWEKERQHGYKHSVERCIEVYRGLEGFTVEDTVKAFYFFKDQYNREFFLSMSDGERALWLRALLEKV